MRLDFQSTTIFKWRADGSKVVLTNGLFGEPLYAWYVFDIEHFQPGDIEGTLLTLPFEIYGPLDSREEGEYIVQSLTEGHTDLDNQSQVT